MTGGAAARERRNQNQSNPKHSGHGGNNTANHGGERRRAATADSATLEDQCHPRKIFIGGLAHKTTTQQLRDYFGRYGSIVDAVVLRWPDGRSRGFGYVTFADAGAANTALKAQHQVGGRQVDTKRAVPGTNKLFVGGLPQNTTAAELREHFEAFGVVSDAVVMIDPATSRSRGFGFVCFLPGQEGASAVIASLEQYQSHRIRGKWIEVKSAAPPHKLAKEEEDEGPSCSEVGSAAISVGGVSTQTGTESTRSVVESSHSRCGSESMGEPQKVGSVNEPQKVALPSTTTMAAALASMGAPPGLGLDDDEDDTDRSEVSSHAAARPKATGMRPLAHHSDAYPEMYFDGAGALPYQMPWAHAVGPHPWAGSFPYTSGWGAASTHKATSYPPGCLGPRPLRPGAVPPGAWSEASSYGAVPPGFFVDGQNGAAAATAKAAAARAAAQTPMTVESKRSALFPTSEGLQKSLEQLLRQHSQMRMEAEAKDKDATPTTRSACPSEIQVDEAGSNADFMTD